LPFSASLSFSSLLCCVFALSNRVIGVSIDVTGRPLPAR
jgi:hypothetical protein